MKSLPSNKPKAPQAKLDLDARSPPGTGGRPVSRSEQMTNAVGSTIDQRLQNNRKPVTITEEDDDDEEF